MAVDGHKLSDTIRRGFDEWHENPCSPCAKEGRNVAAVKYCDDCNENICGKCVSDHNKFATMRGHQISNKLSSETGKKRPELPTQRCDKHGGKLVDVYCSTHDEVGCATCIAVDHSSCNGIRFIPDISTGTKATENILNLNTQMNALLKRLDELKQQKKLTLKHLHKQKDDLRMEIRTLRKKINDQLDKMEKLLDEEVDSIHDGRINSQEESIKGIDAIVSTLITSFRNLQDARNMNESELFVQQKLASSSLKKSSKAFGMLTISKNKILVKLVPNREFGIILAKEDVNFGLITKILIPKSTNHVGDVNVRFQNDEGGCTINDICLTSNGEIVLTDRSNRCLKKLSQKYSVKQYLCLPDDPFALCVVDRSTLAVTLFNKEKVQFVSQNPMALGMSFPVEDSCRGITFHDGQLYVGCGGRKEVGEGEAKICVYTTTGSLLKSYWFDDMGIPSRIKASQNGINIYVSDSGIGNDKLLAINPFNNKCSEVQIRKLKVPLGSSYIGDRQFIYAGYDSNNIVLISEDGTQQEELLTKKDGIVKPGSVCYDVNKSVLIVSFECSDILKAFKLEFEQ